MLFKGQKLHFPGQRFIELRKLGQEYFHGIHQQLFASQTQSLCRDISYFRGEYSRHTCLGSLRIQIFVGIIPLCSWINHPKRHLGFHQKGQAQYSRRYGGFFIAETPLSYANFSPFLGMFSISWKPWRVCVARVVYDLVGRSIYRWPAQGHPSFFEINPIRLVTIVSDLIKQANSEKRRNSKFDYRIFNKQSRSRTTQSITSICEYFLPNFFPPRFHPTLMATNETKQVSSRVCFNGTLPVDIVHAVNSFLDNCLDFQIIV